MATARLEVHAGLQTSLHPHAVAYVENVLRSGWWGYGPVAQCLEQRVAELYDGERQVLATSSCTAAMHLALRTAGVGPGDEVVVPAFTYVSTAVVRCTAARPRCSPTSSRTP